MQLKLTEGKVYSKLLWLTLPMVWGIFAIIFFNVIDTYFVGQLGTTQLAAMTFTFPVVMILGSMAIGLGIGTSSVVARAIGEGNLSKSQNLTTNSLLLSSAIVGLGVMLGLVTINPLFTLLGADSQTLPLIRDYMTTWYWGMLFIVVPMVGNSVIRAAGDTLSPSIIMTIAAFVNIILDPILIFGWGIIPRLELKGAALATVIAYGITFLASIYLLNNRLHLIIWKIPKIDEAWRSWRAILAIGVPAMGTNIINPVSIAILTSLIATYDKTAVAGFGVASRIESFAVIGLMALAASIGPFVGQNWGAKKYGRVREALDISVIFCLVWGIIIAIAMLVVAPVIVSWFNPNPEVISIASMYLRLVSISYGAYGVIVITSAVFNALGKPLSSLFLIFGRMIVLYIPLAYLGSWLLGIKGIFLAACLANLIMGIVAYALERRT